MSEEKQKKTIIPQLVRDTSSDTENNNDTRDASISQESAYLNLANHNRRPSTVAPSRRRLSTAIVLHDMSPLEINEVPEPPYEDTYTTTTENTTPFTTLENFIESLPENNKDKTPQELLEIYGIPFEATSATQTNSLIHNILTTLKTGTALLRGREFYPKSFPVKKKITNHQIADTNPFYQKEFNDRPLLQGLMPLSHELGKINPTDRKVIDEKDITDEEIRALQEKDPNITKLHLSFTPLEILRSIQHGDIKIEAIERENGELSKIILKYKQGYGPQKFQDKNGKIIIKLKEYNGTRKQLYQKISDSHPDLDPERERDSKIANTISEIISIQTGLTDKQDIESLAQLLSENLHTDYKVYKQTEENKGQITEQPLEVLARQVDGGKTIPFGGDIDLQSFTISQELHDSVRTEHKKYLYQPINIISPLESQEEHLESKRKLLHNTTELLQSLEPYYLKKITKILEDIDNKIKATNNELKKLQKRSPNEHEQIKLLQQKILLLREQQTTIQNSKFYKKLKDRELINPPPRTWWQKIFTKRTPTVVPTLPKLGLDELFETEKAREYFTKFAGNITPIQFLDKTIMNDIGQSEFLQHGADHFGKGPTFKLDDGTHLHIFGDKMFTTTTDQQRVQLWLTKDIFESQYIYVNPGVKIDVWAPLIEKQLTSKYKEWMDENTQKKYFEHLFQNNCNELTSLLKKIDNNNILDTKEKINLLTQIKEQLSLVDINDSYQELFRALDAKIDYFRVQLNQEQLFTSSNNTTNQSDSLKERMKNIKKRFFIRQPNSAINTRNFSPANSTASSPKRIAPYHQTKPPSTSTRIIPTSRRVP